MSQLEALALATIAAKETSIPVSAQQVRDLLKDVKGVTFASLITVTDVKLAAAHKAVQIYKVGTANVQLFNNLNAATSVYSNAVKRSAAKDASNEAAAVENFEVQETWYEHTECHSLVQHRKTAEMYLYAIYNSGESVYVHDGKIVTAAEVAAFMTPSDAKKLLTPEPTYNVANDITHNVIVRVLKMSSIIELNAMKQTISV